MTLGAAVLAALGALFGLAVLAGSVWAVLRTSALQASNDRLRNENEDYVRRLNFLEPRVDVLENRNEILENLHNPAESIDKIARQVDRLLTQERSNHDDTMSILNRIDRHLTGNGNNSS